MNLLTVLQAATAECICRLLPAAQHRLGLSPRQLSTVTWPEVARRIVDAQKQTRLCIARDLSEVDVVARIMRKENYLIGLLNKAHAKP